MTNALRSLSLALLFTAIATGCSRAEPAVAEPAADASNPSNPVERAFAQPAPATAEASGSQNGGSTPTAAVQLNGQCRGARNALASCAEAKTCDDDIAMFLPAASRDALIVLENKPGYSSDAFDGYCLKACQSRSAAVDEAAFAGDVCGSAPSPADAATNPPAAAPAEGASAGPQTVAAFDLRQKLDAPAAKPLALNDVLGALGQPQAKRTTPYECDSAFEEGDIQLYSYPDIDVETDGRTAVVRRVRLAGGNAVELSGGDRLDARTTRDDLRRSLGRIEHGPQSERVSAQPDGSMESSYDFHFDASGKLVSVDYWIGC